MRHFRHTALQYCATITDKVLHMRLSVKTASTHTLVRAQLYFLTLKNPAACTQINKLLESGPYPQCAHLVIFVKVFVGILERQQERLRAVAAVAV